MNTLPTGAEGPAERELRLFGYSHVAFARAAAVVVSGLVGLSAVPEDALAVTVVVVSIAVGWTGVYFWALTRRGAAARWLLPADLVVMAGVCLTQSLTVSPEELQAGGGWVRTAASVSVLTYQWHTRAVPGGLAAAFVAIAYVAGATWSSPGTWDSMAPKGPWIVAEAALARTLNRLVRREARRADRLLAGSERTRRETAVAAARRTEEREYLASLHDTAAATLLMVGLGTADERRSWLSEQAERDLKVLTGQNDVTVRDINLTEMLAAVAARSGLVVDVETNPSPAVPPLAGVAICRCVQEALTNVERHAGVDRATVRVENTGDGTVVEVVDEGRGFTPEGTASRGRGITDSIVGRMARAGGRAAVISRPGHGTRVRLEWSGTGVESPAGGCRVPEPAVWTQFGSVTAGRMLRRLRLAVLGIITATLLAVELPNLAMYVGGHSWPAVHVAAYVTFAAVALCCGVLVLRDASLDRWRWPLLSVVFAAGTAATLTVPSAHVTTWQHWAYGNVGWFAVLLLGHRPVPFVAVLSADFAVTLAKLAGEFDQRSPIDAVTASLIIWASQIIVAMAAGRLRRVVDAAMATAAEDERLRIEDAVGEQLHRDRRSRYAALANTVVPLLAGLASGVHDPGDERVRRACSVEAARMRRLFAERDEVADPLIHELQACVDVAERRGVAVSFATRGSGSRMPSEVRRALTEPALTVLTTAASTARVSVVASGTEVTVSVLADLPRSDLPRSDLPRSDLPRSTLGTVTVTTRNIEDRLWMEATWRPDQRPDQRPVRRRDIPSPRR
ncbi:ATP-binding protein [Actinomadura sp. 6N118]|uniref:sensor histidine kinase n=1 Tax=Actinomadura sp. 6N118 TaxID=3375151 RepID=UPI0037A378CC